MNKSIFRSGITFAGCVTCSAVTYACGNNYITVALFTSMLAGIFTLISAGVEDV